MDAEEIRQYVECSSVLKETFRGVYPNFTYPVELSWGSYIINSEPDMPGRHWLAAYKCKTDDVSNKVLLFFDSFGKSPAEWHMDFAGDEVLYNDIRVQPADSELCAMYCIYFIYLKNMNFTMSDIIDSFYKKNNELNDMMMLNFAAELRAGYL